MAIEVTDEMRKAVLAEMCEQRGHSLSASTAMSHDDQNRLDIKSTDAGKLPHLSCTQCGKVWIVMSEPGEGYDDAEKKLRTKMKDTTEIDELRKVRKSGKS